MEYNNYYATPPPIQNPQQVQMMPPGVNNMMHASPIPPPPAPQNITPGVSQAQPMSQSMQHHQHSGIIHHQMPPIGPQQPPPPPHNYHQQLPLQHQPNSGPLPPTPHSASPASHIHSSHQHNLQPAPRQPIGPPPHPHMHQQSIYPHYSQPPHPGYMQHPSQQMTYAPQPTYYQPTQQHMPHPMTQNPYMQYPPQAHPHYYPHHTQQMQPPPPHQSPYAVAQPHPNAPPQAPPMYPQHPPQHPHHPHPQSHPQPHWVHPPPPVPQGPPPPHPHQQQQMIPHPPQPIPHPPPPAYYQPAQPPQAGPPQQPQQLPPPASPHHTPSRTHTPTRVPPPSSTPASPSNVPKVEKKEIVFPKNSVEATKPVATKKRKLTAKDVIDIEIWRVLMCLKSGLLAESSWAIDVLSVLLNDDSTSLHFGLQHMPGLLEAVLEHFKCCLNELFDGLVKDTTLVIIPAGYNHWQEGNGEDTSHIQVSFEPNNFLESSRRCTSLSTIIRNLSFIPGNDVEMSKHAGLLLVLGRLLLLKHDDLVHNEAESAPMEWHLLSSLREDTLVIISNISSSLDLCPYNDKINLSLLDGLLHWACCSSSYAQDPFPAPSMTVSPQRLALESLAKLSIIEGNVDLILATPPWLRIEKLFGELTRLLNINEDQTIREFSLVLLSNLTAADSGIARKVAMTGSAIPRLLSFLETSLADPETYATTQDMLRRAAITLKCLSQLVDNHPFFVQHQQRLLNLVMSPKLDQEVVPIIADVIFEISLSD